MIPPYRHIISTTNRPRFRSYAWLLCTLLFLLMVTRPTHAQDGNYTAGQGAGASITTGDFNTAVGDSAARNLTSGSNNTILGYRAGRYFTTGSRNVLLGTEVGLNLATRLDNTLLGYRAGYHGTADDNTLIGTRAGYHSTTATNNTFVGEEAGCQNLTGSNNTFLGEDVGGRATCFQSSFTPEGTGDYNTFIGRQSGYSFTSGFRNTGVGRRTLGDVTTSFRNTAVGDSAGTDIGEGHNNTFFGQAAGGNTEHGEYNTFIGAYAGWDNNRENTTTEGHRNTYIGFRTGFSTRDFSDNVGVGAEANYTISRLARISESVFIGAEAESRQSNTNGTVAGNVLIGYSTRVLASAGLALGSNADVTANQSIALGADATLTAANSIAVGYQASGSAANSIAFGNGSSVSAINEVNIGNAALISIGGIVNWTATSDARFKTDVTADVPGLAFVRRLKPVRYRFATEALQQLAPTLPRHVLMPQVKMWQTGFLAQDVAQAAQAEAFAFSGVVSPVEGRTYHGLRYAEFVVPLTQAIQELDAANLAERVVALEHLVDARDARLAQQKQHLAQQRILLSRYEQFLAQLSIEQPLAQHTGQPQLSDRRTN